jgi:hypothetical protein
MKDHPPILNVYKASKMLQQKVGAGPLDEEVVKKSQKVLDENDVDFTPMGLQFLGKLEAALKQANDASIDMKVRKQALTAPVMELKANASIFKYNLIGTLANIMLSFLESTPTLDKDAITIVDAHHKTLHMIVVKKMTGDGGQHGEIFVRELKDACARYHAARLKKEQKQ